MLKLMRIFMLVLLLTANHISAFGQRYLTDYDSSLFIRDTVRPVVLRLQNLFMSGYIQPQFQIAESEGTRTYAGGDFAEYSNNRFMLRRARLRSDYVIPSHQGQFPLAIFTFQFDATERGVVVRDMYLRVFEPGKHNFSLAMGLLARPFGYEVNLASAFRETPERGRMSQTLMPAERDLGGMITYESQNLKRKKFQVKIDAGIFNGPGLSGTTDFDKYKDFISRITVKPFDVNERLAISGGLSYFNGGWRQATKYRNEIGLLNGRTQFVTDSSELNIGQHAARIYYGADMQLIIRHARGKTELRGEYWKGQQPGTSASTTSPGTLPLTPVYIRKFDGVFFYFLQNIVNEHWELMAKYDWYDPNTLVSGKAIDKATNLTSADIKFTTLGLGATYYIRPTLKILGYYDFVMNETTGLDGFTRNIPDNVFTLRMQLRF